MAQPLHRRIADQLRHEILSGKIVPGSTLASEHELAKTYGVSRGTVRHALNQLRSEGAVAARRGAGWVVLGAPLAQSFSELLSFSSWARSQGHEPGASVMELARRPAREDDAQRLGVSPGEPVFKLIRVRTLTGTPVMIERTTFIEAIGILLVQLDLEAASIYEQLGDHGIVFARARHTIDAVSASAEDAALLEISRQKPLLRQRRLSTSQTGQPLESSDDRYRGDAVAFVIDNTAMTGNLERMIATTHDELR